MLHFSVILFVAFQFIAEATIAAENPIKHQIEEDYDLLSSYTKRLRTSPLYFELRCAVELGIVNSEDFEKHKPQKDKTDSENEENIQLLESVVKYRLESSNYHIPGEFTSTENTINMQDIKYFNEFKLNSHELNSIRSDMRLMHEPELSVETSESYRLLIWRSFHLPISIRVIKSPKGGLIISKLLNNDKNIEQSQLCVRIETSIYDAQFKALRHCFSEPSIWKTDYDERNRRIRDGSTWLLEARQGDNYHYALLRSPEEGPLYDCALLMLEWSGFPTLEIY